MAKITKGAPTLEQIVEGLANRVAALEIEAQERAEMARIAEEKKQARYVLSQKILVNTPSITRQELEDKVNFFRASILPF